MTEPEQKQLNAIVDKFIDEASEFADSVRVFVTKYDGVGNETTHMTDGRGNMFAQQAQVREWLIRQDELVRQNTIARGDTGGEESE